jgi:hypothetical protein
MRPLLRWCRTSAIGRMLDQEEATKLIRRIERGIPSGRRRRGNGKSCERQPRGRGPGARPGPRGSSSGGITGPAGFFT